MYYSMCQIHLALSLPTQSEATLHIGGIVQEVSTVNLNAAPNILPPNHQQLLEKLE